MASHLSRENIQEVWGLSPIQQSLAGSDDPPRAGEGPLVEAGYLLEGDVDPELLSRAWDEVIRRTPALRAVFPRLRNRTVQVVLRDLPSPLDARDWRDRDPAGREEAQAELARLLRRPFDLAEGPLVRLGLARLRDDLVLLLMTHHPAVLDDLGRELALDDVLTLSATGQEGQAGPPPPRLSYGSYLTWLAKQDMMPAKEFWRSRITGWETPLAPAFRGGRGRTGKDDAGGYVSRVRELDEGLSRALGNLAGAGAPAVGPAARTVAATPRTIVAAAWAVLLGVHTGESDILFGLLTSGRPAALPGAESVIGRLAGALPLRVSLAEHPRLPDLLTATGELMARLDDWSYTPLAEVRAAAGIPAGRDFFATCVWVREPAAGPSRRLTSLDGGDLDRWPLTLTVTPGPAWHLRLRGRRDAYDEVDLDAILGHLETLLAGLAARPDAHLADLPVLTATEEGLVDDFSRGEPDEPLERLFMDYFAEQVSRGPDAVAASVGQATLTYRELDAESDSLAQWLRAKGFGPNDLAGLFASRGLPMLAAIVAVAKAGGAYVPLDPAYPDARLVGLLETSEAKVILTEDGLAARAAGLARQAALSPLVFRLDRAAIDLGELAGLPGGPLASVAGPRDLANVFFTSGSTGLPKGAMIEHAGMVNHLRAKIRLLGLSETSVVIQNASHCFDISVWQFLAPLMVGGRVAICDPETASDPRALLAFARGERATVLEVVPTMLDLIAGAAEDMSPAERALPDLRFLFSTGEALSVALCRRWLALYPEISVVNGYGATECSDDTTQAVISVPPAENEAYTPVGRPIANSRTYVLDPWGRPVPPGCVGEVFFTGVGVGRGYVNDPDRTAPAFLPNPFVDGTGDKMYRTGDLGFQRPDGQLVFAGRRDDQVKIRGHRIELGEIEAALRRYPGLDEGVVVARPDSQGRNRLLAYVVAAGQAGAAGEGGRAGAVARSPVDVSAVADFLRTLLPEPMIPEHIMVLPGLPVTRNGKVDRRALPDPLEVARAVGAVGPRTALEQTLAEIWGDILGLAVESIDDNFFLLGGHSLRTVQVRARIRQRLGVDVPIRALFENPTIRGLGPIIEGLLGRQPASRDGAIIPKPKRESAPLTNAQKRLWFLQKLDPPSYAYNMTAAVDLEGSLDVVSLERALATVTRRHAILRSTLMVVDGEPIYRISPDAGLILTKIDLTRSAGPAEAELIRFIETEGETPFDLEAGPAVRAFLIRMAPGYHVLLLNKHHIAGDAWSWGILTRELATLYDAYARGEPDPLPPLPLQYGDYAEWLLSRAGAGDLKAAEDYWLARLAGELPGLNLPADHPRPPVQTSNGRTASFDLDVESLDRLRRLGQDHGCTLFMVLLAAAGVLLGRLSGQTDLIIGTPVSGRNLAELEDLIGFFVNTVALRLDLGGAPTFEELLGRVRDLVLDSLAHQDYPFDQLVERLNPQRDLSRSPVVSIMFQVNLETPAVPLTGLVLRPRQVPETGAAFDLSLAGTERADGLTLAFEYNTDLYEPGAVARWMGHLQTLLLAMLADPRQPVHLAPLLDPQERRLILETWNRAEAPDKAIEPSDFVHHRFEAQAKAAPANVAVIDGETTLTYAEVDRRGNRLAGRLRAAGVGPEALVGICLDRSADAVVAVLATLKAGGAFVPLDPSYPVERLLTVLGDSRVSVLLTRADLAARLPEGGAGPGARPAAGGATLLLMEPGDDPSESRDDGVSKTTDPVDPGVDLSGENLAYVIHTSGSTGRPKGVMISHGALAAMTRGWEATYFDSSLRRVLQMASLSFDVFICDLARAWTAGAAVVICPAEDLVVPERLYRLMSERRIDFADFVPAVFRNLAEYLEDSGRSLDFLEVLSIGSDVWTVEEYRRFARLCGPRTRLINGYGVTEAAAESSIFDAAGTQLPPQGAVPIGHPHPGVRFYVLDEHLSPAPIGVAGELYIGGVGVARGYLNQPGLTAERFLPDPFGPGRLYRTGDLARYLSDGAVQLLGRADSQVKIRGFRVELGEVETILRQHPGVRDALASIRSDADGGVYLAAYVVPENRAGLEPAVLKDFAGARLPYYMVPSAWVSLEAIPLLPNGKVDKGRLPDPRGGQTRSAVGVAVPPRDTLEAGLCGVWARVLGVESVGVCDDFFALGGHSLKMMVLAGAIKDKLGIEVSILTLFQAPTVAELRERLRREVPAAGGNLLELATGSHEGPPLFLVHPGGGGALCYFDLARALGGRRVYGLQASGVDSDEAPLVRIEDMVTRYLDEVLRTAPEGPYLLAGWSFGATVAFEMARRLEGLGREVAFVGLVDGHPLGAEFSPGGLESPREFLIDYAVSELGLDRAVFAGAAPGATAECAAVFAGAGSGRGSGEVAADGEADMTDRDLGLVYDRLRELALIPSGATGDLVRRLAGVMYGLRRADYGYEFAGPIESDLHLFLATGQRTGERSLPPVDEAEWRRRTRGDLITVGVPGDHYNLMRAPHVGGVAWALRTVLDSASGQVLGSGKGVRKR